MVPSWATHIRDPFSLPTVSPLVRITWARGVLNKVHRAHIFSVLARMSKDSINIPVDRRLLCGPKCYAPIVCPPNNQPLSSPLVFDRE